MKDVSKIATTEIFRQDIIGNGLADFLTEGSEQSILA